MQEKFLDMNRELTLDGNAIAGVLQEIFGSDMTAIPSECASCGNQAEIGTLLAFIHGPGVVLRCSACKQIVLRIVETPDSIFIDGRGATFIKLSRLRD
jgi:hypothetical protein